MAQAGEGVPRTTSASFNIPPARDFLLSIDVTAITATPAVTPRIEVQDDVSGNWFTVWTAAAAITDVTGVKTYVYAFVKDKGNLQVQNAIMEIEEIMVSVVNQMRVFMAHGDTDSITYSVSTLELLRSTVQ